MVTNYRRVAFRFEMVTVTRDIKENREARLAGQPVLGSRLQAGSPEN
jgi:hypothetical protein